jgi:hypothetical protein
MSFLIIKNKRVAQRSALLPDFNNPLNRSLLRMWNAADGLQLYDSLNGTRGTVTGTGIIVGTAGGQAYDNTTSSTDVVDLGVNPKITSTEFTVACLCVPQQLSRSDVFCVWDGGGAAGDVFDLILGLTSGKPKLFTLSGNSGDGASYTVGSLHMFVGRQTSTNGIVGAAGNDIYTDGVLGAHNPVSDSPPSQTAHYRIGNNGQGDGYAKTQIIWTAAWNRALTADEIRTLGTNPWQLYRPGLRRLWKQGVVSTNLTGGASSNLGKITETSAGKIGVIAGVTETLSKITETGTGVQTIFGSATDTLKKILELGGGQFGTAVVGGGSVNLKLITESSTGKIGVIAGAVETLGKVTESSTGKIGVIAGVTETLNKITESATGKLTITNIVGFAASNIGPIQEIATGFNPNPLAQPVSQGGAPAWWGYEGFDGTRRPWWYKDLKDKAKELERLRKLRIKLGILPPDETAISDTVDEILEFVEETPTPATADYYIARQEALSARIEALVDNMQEEEDEQAIMKMSKFFFPRNEARTWQ